MRPFNQDDFNLVKDYERDFARAIDSRYATGLLQSELEVIHRIYGETLNRQANLSCGGCVLQMMTSVGRLYFAFKKKMEEEARKALEVKPKRKRSKKNEDKTES